LACGSLVLTSVHLQFFLTSCKVSVAQLGVVIFVCHLAEQVDTVKLMEDLEANSISFNTGFWVNSSQVRLGHANYVQFFVGNNLVTNYKLLVSGLRFPKALRLLSYEIACHALSTSGPDPT
jgi:hypothetical protein